MAEFLRKKRFLKYQDDNCKKFLSKDFQKRCAYCKIREGDLAGPESFEKDHFIPLAKGGPDDYDNLYYSCASCNGKAGKSDTWSATLLDPCKDDIWGTHVKIAPDYRCEDLTERGSEYIKTFKLNRKSYVVRRRTIEQHQMELREKLEKYENIVAVLCAEGKLKQKWQCFENDIHELKTILAEGVNYRMSREAFDEETDEMIIRELEKAGKLRYVDRDYDLIYELECGKTKFLCYVDTIDVNFEEKDKVKKFISANKIEAWESVGVIDQVLLIFFNRYDKKVYYFELKDILNSKRKDMVSKYGYDLDIRHTIEKLRTKYGNR